MLQTDQDEILRTINQEQVIPSTPIKRSKREKLRPRGKMGEAVPNEHDIVPHTGRLMRGHAPTPGALPFAGVSLPQPGDAWARSGRTNRHRGGRSREGASYSSRAGGAVGTSGKRRGGGGGWMNPGVQKILSTMES